MTILDNKIYDDPTSAVQRRNKLRNYSLHDPEKINVQIENWKERKTPNYIMPLIIAGAFAGVAIQDIHSELTFSYLWHISYVIIMAGVFGFLSVLQVSQFWIDMKKDLENKLLTNLSHLTMFCGDFFTFVAIAYLLLNNEKIIKFFDLYLKVSERLIHYIKSDETPKLLYLLYGVYSSLTIASSAGIASSFWITGQNNSIFLTSEWQDNWDTIKYPGLIFYILKPIVVMISWGYFEVTLAIMAYLVHTLFQRVNSRVARAMDEYEQQEALWNLENKLTHLDEFEKEIQEYTNSSQYEKEATNEDLEDHSKQSTPVTIPYICDLTLNSMEEHYLLSDLTRNINGVFGPLLLFDLCLYLLMITALLYGTVKGIGLQVPSVDTMLAFNNINYIIRLFIILLIYSKVNRSANEIVLTYTRVMSVAPDTLTHRISLYIQQLGNNPVGISAWGFFIVTLGTMLTFWGSAITYLVVLFKNAAEKSA